MAGGTSNPGGCSTTGEGEGHHQDLLEPVLITLKQGNWAIISKCLEEGGHFLDNRTTSQLRAGVEKVCLGKASPKVSVFSKKSCSAVGNVGECLVPCELGGLSGRGMDVW